MNYLLSVQLREIYEAETQVVAVLPQMVDAAEDANLEALLRAQLHRTKQHLARVSEVCRLLSISVQEQESKLPEANSMAVTGEKYIFDLCTKAENDRALLAAAQRIEGYEIASYSSAITFAECLDEMVVADLLKANLAEEKAAEPVMESFELKAG